MPGSGRNIRQAGTDFFSEAGGKTVLKRSVLAECSILEGMNVTKDIVMQAIGNAAKGYHDKRGVSKMMADVDSYADFVINEVASGSYKDKLHYRKLTKQNANGKVRYIDSPMLFTFVLQHLFLCMAKPLYESHDNYNGLNCKKGCGITSSDKAKSVIHKVKHLMYDRRDLNYCVIIDQRKCYDHVTPKVFRREMRRLTDDRELIEFGVSVGFVEGRLPIGTPTSPVIHHVVMLRFDQWSKQVAPFSVRYADDCLFATRTKEEASELKWRIQNHWWYDLQIRAKSSIRMQPLEKEVSFCGYVVRRNAERGIASHDKGYATVRSNIRSRAIKCRRDESWASYYGILQHADTYNLMQKIERNMKLRNLTEKIRIDRKLDAPNINPKDLVGKVFTIFDYELRSDAKGTPNWIKCLIGIDEIDEEGRPTGKMLAYEFHGSYMYIVEFMYIAQKEFGKDKMLPLEEMEIENQCGYIFKGSTNQMTYIEPG